MPDPVTHVTLKDLFNTPRVNKPGETLLKYLDNQPLPPAVAPFVEHFALTKELVEPQELVEPVNQKLGEAGDDDHIERKLTALGEAIKKKLIRKLTEDSPTATAPDFSKDPLGFEAISNNSRLKEVLSGHLNNEDLTTDQFLLAKTLAESLGLTEGDKLTPLGRKVRGQLRSDRLTVKAARKEAESVRSKKDSK